MVIFKLKFLDTDNKNCVRHFTWNFIFKCTAFGLHYNPVRFLHLKTLRLREVIENTAVYEAYQLGLPLVFI